MNPMDPTQRAARVRQFHSDADRWRRYEERVQAMEALGMTRSDAQGVIDAEDMKTEQGEQ